MEQQTEVAAPAASEVTQPTEAVDNAASSVSSPSESAANQTTTEAPKDGQAATNFEAQYRSLIALRAEDEKRYENMRKLSSRQGNENSQVKKQLEALTQNLEKLGKKFSEITAQPFDHEKFMEDFKAKGPDALAEALDGHLSTREQKIISQMAAMQTQVQKLHMRDVYREVKSDAESYPDFSQLEPTMMKLYEQMVQEHADGISNRHPNDLDPSVLIPSLYNLAKIQHGPDALKQAEAKGLAKANAALANEANTSVAGGGKATSSNVADPDKMPLKDLRAHLIKNGMGSADLQ